MLLISSMFLSMAYVALTGKEENLEESKYGKENKNVEQNLRINISSEPPTLHPGLSTDITSGSVLLQTFEGLTRIDLWGKTVNAAAKVIKISKDQKTYIFTLRDAKWSNGDPVTAKDFEYAWKWALDPTNHSASAYQLYYIDGAREYNEGKGSANKVGVKALDDKNLEVKLVNPTQTFLQLTALPIYFPINSKVAEENSEWAEDLRDYSTNGPFELIEWSHNEKIVLKKSKNYWDSNTVRLKTITMLMVNNPITELSMFDNGEIDWAGSPMGHLPISGMQSFIEDGMVNTGTVTGHYLFNFNTRDEPFNNENMRKAFALSINRKELIDSVGYEGLTPALAIVPPTLVPENKKGYFKDDDVENAKKYFQNGLEELGYKNVNELPPVTLSLNLIGGNQKIAQVIQKMWKENLGVKVILEKNNKNINIFDYEIPPTGWIGEFNDPLNFLEMYRNRKLDNNGTGWENEEFKTILKQTQTETDPNKHLKLLKKAETVLMDKMPVIPIYFYSNYWVQNEDLKGVALYDLDHIQFKWAYFEKE
jgi:oligopeptide transport system substrate-binding protein